jgi:hypothetical protein
MWNSMQWNRGTARFAFALTACVLLMLATPAPTAVEANNAGSDAATYVGERPVTVRQYVKARASRAGWTLREWRALAELIRRESGWDPVADNPDSTAYGLFQILRMPEGAPLRVQVERGIRYIKSRYVSPSAALAHHDRFGWF